MLDNNRITDTEQVSVQTPDNATTDKLVSETMSKDPSRLRRNLPFNDSTRVPSRSIRNNGDSKLGSEINIYLNAKPLVLQPIPQKG